jgi:aldehyde dehydrogenase (NAD+)
MAVEAPPRPSFANFVAGSWQPARSGETFEKRNPARPSEVIGDFPSSGAEDVDAAVAAAAAAYADWSRRPFAQRAAVLYATAEAIEGRLEQIAQDMTAEMGKPLREARMETARGAQILRFYAGEAWRPKGEMFEQSGNGQLVYTLRRPLGVVGLVTPWNFPLAIPLWKLSPALVYGNAVVLKLASEAPLSGLHMAECFEEAGLPAGVLNVVLGSGSKVGNAIVRHPEVRALSFTGSVPTGQAVRDEATRLGKRVQLELGGHNPLIVMADANLDKAVEGAYAGAFWSAGQKCTATRRIFVEDAAYDDFRARFLDRIERGKVGDPSDPATEVGPIVSEKQLNDVLSGIERGRSEGGRVIAGGERADEEAYLVAPTVFEGVPDDGFLSCQEVFGPVTTLYRFSTLDEALSRANAVEFGLSASIFTSDLGTTTRFVNELEAGLLHVNSQTAGADVHVPFGGIKSSGFGPHEQGRSAMDFYTEVVTVYQDPPA